MKRKKIQLKLPFNAREDLNSSDFLYNYSNITSVDHMVREHCWLFIDVVSFNKFFSGSVRKYVISKKMKSSPKTIYRYSNFHVLRIFDFSAVVVLLIRKQRLKRVRFPPEIIEKVKMEGK